MGYKRNNKTSAIFTAVKFLFILCCLTLNPARAFAAVDINIASFTDTPDPVPSLGQFDYDLRIDNSGDTQADNVVLTVPIPPEVTIQSLTPGAGPIPNCTHSGGVLPAAAAGGTVTCNLGSVPASTNQLVTISAQATVPGPASAAITATVTTTTPGEINIANNSSGESTTITRGADLVLAKTGPAAAAGAEIITFNLDITNNGLNDATTFEIVDTLPPGFTYQSFSGAGWSCAPAGQVITCNHSGGILVGNMAPTLGIDVQVTAASTGVLVNSATTASTDPLVGDGDASNNTTTHPVTITAGTDLRVTKLVSSDPIIGDAIGETFTIQVNNLGPMTANNLTVTDAIPDTLAVGGFTVTNVAGAGWDCSGSAGLNVNCTRATLAVGAAPDIVVTVDAPISADIPAGGEPQTNTAIVTSTTTDPIPGNDSGGVSYTLQRNEADLGLSKSKTPNPVAVGSNMTSTITVRNFGPQTATGAMRVTDQLDVNETYVPAGSGGAGWTCVPAGQLITCDHANAGGIAPGGTLPDITIISTANAPGVLSNTACTSGSTSGGPTLPNEGDSNAANDCSGAIGVLATAQIADLTLNKIVDKPVLVNNDNTLTYTLTVTNNGPDSATNVELNDNIPMFFTGPPATGVIAVPSQGACPTVGANVTCNLGTITNGSNATVTITVDRPMRDSVAQPGGIWTNTATAFSLDIGDDNRADNTDTASTAVNAATDLELQSKTVTPNPVLAGVETTYVMTIRNNGPSQADNVVLTDVFVPDAPETYTLISATPTSGSCNPLVGNTLTCNMGNMSSGQVQSVTVVVRPDYRVAAPATWNLHNDASVSTTTYEEDIALGGPNNNTQSADLTVNTADIELLVNVADDVDPVPYDPAGAPPTNIITYEVILNNLGPSLATSVQFVDRITSMPAGQQLIFQCDKSAAGAACPALGSQICNNQSTVINPAPPVDITCIVGDLPANTTFTRYLDFEVQNQPAVSGDTVINQVTVSGAEPETILGNNVVTEETTVRVSTDLGITSKVAAPATASIMEPFNWTITVENNGAGDSQLTTVTDNLPAGMELTGAPVPAQGTCTGVAGSTSFSCSLGVMLSPPVLPVPPNPPTQTTITAPVRMTTYPGGGSVNNCAAVADTETVDQVPANDSNCGSVTITRSSIEGFVYIDLNNDGVMLGAGETGIAGVQINLTGTDAFGNVVNRNVNTDGAGRFFFNDLAPSNGAGYTLTQPVQPATFFDGMETAGSAGGNTAVNEIISTIVLPGNTASTGYLFGELASASISGTVYADTNGNSAQDVGEPGIPNVTVTLTGTDVNSNAINVPATTDANGDFQFTNQPPSDVTGYTITESHPNGWVDAGETAGSAGGNTAVNEVISAIPLVSGAAETGYLFGETGGSLAGIVYEDTNNDGVVDGFDPRLPAETVTLTGTDINGNPVNQIEATLADGSYLFENLASPNGAGYTITETQPAGFVDGQETLGTLGGTAGNNVFSAIPFPAAGANGTGYNFGELRAAQISGFVYRDLNDDGDMVGAGETGLAGIQMRLTGTDFFSVPVNLLVNTLADGSFSFDNLEPSDATGYTITQVAQPAGFIDGQENDKGVIVPGSIATDVISGIVLPQDTALPGHLFGEVPEADISGVVYADLDGDGSQGGGEPGIPNVTVTLTGTDFRGNVVNIPTTTNATGNYQFTALPPSNGTGYTITETQPGGWIDGTDVVGTAGGTLANDIISDIVLAAGASESGYLFGETGGSLAGTVYNDISGDGIKDPIEPGIPGTTVTLTGTDVNGTVINLVTTTDGAGDYLFEGLPVPNATGYTITETQPPGNTDGLDAIGSLGGTLGNDVLSDILFPAAGANGTDYDFGETTTITAQLSGTVWLDSNLDRIDNEAGGQSGWAVEIIQRVDPLDNTNFTLIATTTTDANGDYSFTGLIPGGGYEVRFLHPFNNSVFGNPQSVEPGVDLSFGTIRNLTLAGGANVIDQDQPLDPQGVVYDSLTRLPVAGASVTFNGPGGFDPALHLVGGLANQTQITDATGLYQFLLLGGAPAGTYTLTIVEPPGYLPGVSVIIPPCTNTLTSVAVPDPALVHANVAAPIAASPIHDPATCPATTATLAATAASTQYYLSFVLTPGVSADVINNHIPVDLITQGALTTRKTTPKTNVVRGELVPYTISVTNNLTAALPAIIDIRDQIPAGFKYRVGSATLDGVSTEPTINGRLLTWPNNAFAAGEEHVINLLLVVGSGVGEGEYVNQAFAVNNLAGLTVSNVATATVRVIPDPLFDCTDLIGKVFNDQNANGYQDKGEPGVAAVKLATARGLIIKTDDKGRFHVPCAAVPNELRGSNFILKLDERSLPTGFRITTENPRVVRLTRGKMAKINFGASLFRVVRADVSAKAFKPDSYELSPKFSQHLEKLYNVLRKKPSVLRVSYLANGEGKKLIKKRLKTIRKMLKARWDDCDCHFELIIEEEIKHRGRGK